MTMASPPPHGIGAKWELRSLGLSRMDFLRTSLRIIKVRIKDKANAIAMKNDKFIVLT